MNPCWVPWWVICDQLSQAFYISSSISQYYCRIHLLGTWFHHWKLLILKNIYSNQRYKKLLMTTNLIMKENMVSFKFLFEKVSPTFKLCSILMKYLLKVGVVCMCVYSFSSRKNKNYYRWNYAVFLPPNFSIWSNLRAFVLRKFILKCIWYFFKVTTSRKHKQ